MVIRRAILRAGGDLPGPDGIACAALAGGPFADDPKTSAEPVRVQPAPELGAVPAATDPFPFQPRQPGGQAAFTNAEHIFALAAQDLADELSAQAGLPHDPADRHAISGHLADHPIGLPASQKALVLQPFRGRQQFGVNRLRSDRLADGGQAPLHSGQEGGAGILEEVPAVGDLHRVRQGARDGTAIAAVAVPGDDLDAGTRPQPGLHRRGLAIRQQVDHPVPLQIADQRAVTLTTPPRPVINADDARFAARGLLRGGPNAAQEGILADRQQEPPGERLRGTSAKSKAEVPDQALEARGASCVRPGNNGREPLREDPGRTVRHAASKAANQQDQRHRSAMRGQIGRLALIPAVDMARNRATARTGRRRSAARPSVDADRLASQLNLIGLETRGQKIPSSGP